MEDYLLHDTPISGGKVGGVVAMVSAYRGFEHDTCLQLKAASLFHAVHPNVDRTEHFEHHVRSFS